MKIDWSFPKQVAVAFVIVAGLSGYPLVVYGTAEMLKSAITGAVLAMVNVLLGYAAIEYSFGKSTTTFFKYVLGGMGIRLLFMALALVVMIKFIGMHVGALIGSLGIFYVVFLTLEVLFIQKKINIQHHS